MLINKNYFFASFWAFIAVVALLYNSMFGSIAALIFLISGLVFVMSNFVSSFECCKRNWIVFLIPLWALLSALWSDISVTATRASIQFMLTTIFAVVIASKVNIETLLRAMAIAMLLAMLMCLFSSRTALNGLTGEVSLIGIFDSKNFLASNTAISIFVGLSLFLNQKIDKKSRLIGGLLLFISLLVLIKAKSFGAIVFVFLTIFSSFVLVFYQNIKLLVFTRRTINRSIVVLFLLSLFLVINSLIQGSFDEFMYSIGKDPTLTGRTYIWQRGLEIIAENPILGVGYQSLFYVGNDSAEDIWEFAHVASGAGFNFHNMYVDITVELGLIGLILFIFWNCTFFHRIFALRSIALGSQYYFSILVFIFLFLQTFLEAVWLDQFTINHLFVCMAWVYLQEKTVYVSE